MRFQDKGQGDVGFAHAGLGADQDDIERLNGAGGKLAAGLGHHFDIKFRQFVTAEKMLLGGAHVQPASGLGHVHCRAVTVKVGQPELASGFRHAFPRASSPVGQVVQGVAPDAIGGEEVDRILRHPGVHPGDFLRRSTPREARGRLRHWGRRAGPGRTAEGVGVAILW